MAERPGESAPAGALRRVYLTGATGLLGQALMTALRPGMARGDVAVRGVSIEDFAISDRAALLESVADFAPDTIVHLAACAFVDTCEAEPARAEEVNYRGTVNVVAAAQAHGCRLIHLSTDYLFDGTRCPAGGYTEDAVPRPLNVYGSTKLAAERHVLGELATALVVRTAWLYGGGDPRTSFVLDYLRRARAGETVEAIVDQIGSPTYARSLADGLVGLLRTPVSGILHLVDRGAASWYEVGLAALAQAGLPAISIRPVAMDASSYRAQRPARSVLDCGRYDALVAGPRPHWTASLRRYLDDEVADIEPRDQLAQGHAG